MPLISPKLQSGWTERDPALIHAFPCRGTSQAQG